MRLGVAFAVSLALNVALAAVVVRQFARVPAEGGLSPAAAPLPAADRIAEPTVTTPRPSAPLAETRTPAPLLLPPVDGDYGELMSRLREMGLPEDMIMDVVAARVNRDFRARLGDGAAAPGPFEYWRTGDEVWQLGRWTEEDALRLQRLGDERRAVLAGLVGEDSVDDYLVPLTPNRLRYWDYALDYLSPAERREVVRLRQRYVARMSDAMKQSRREEDRMERAREVWLEEQQALLDLLGPEGKEQYDLRVSQTAHAMRSELSGFDPAPDEFREIHRIRKQLDDEWNMRVQHGDEDYQAYQAAQADVEAQIEDYLGSARYAEYTRARDPFYQGMLEVGRSLSLPDETAAALHGIHADAAEQAQRIRSTAGGARDMNAALAGLRLETEQRMESRMGIDGWREVRRSSYYRMLDQIGPRPPDAP